MKIVKRIGVFETNSSSTHTLTLVSKQDYEADKATAKPKYRKYGVVATKEDKLLMACGCCEEMFLTEEQINEYAGWGDEYSVKRKEEYDEIKRCIANGLGDSISFAGDDISYELAVSFAVRVYCELTGDNFDKKYDEIIHNESQRYLHMKFFDEGALSEPKWDYLLIYDLFHWDESEMLDNLRHYFDDEFVLLYRECYGSGARLLDDDDD